MLDSLIPVDYLNDGSDTEPDSQMEMSPTTPPNPFLRTQNPEEAALEAREAHKYLLAKSFFDTREYDRCSAVFLPPSLRLYPSRHYR